MRYRLSAGAGAARHIRRHALTAERAAQHRRRLDVMDLSKVHNPAGQTFPYLSRSHHNQNDQKWLTWILAHSWRTDSDCRPAHRNRRPVRTPSCRWHAPPATSTGQDPHGQSAAPLRDCAGTSPAHCSRLLCSSQPALCLQTSIWRCRRCWWWLRWFSASCRRAPLTISTKIQCNN